MKRFTIFLLFTFLGAFAHAEEITVHVDGMVCSFCAQGIIKKFQEQPGVEKVNVSLEEKSVTITTAKDKTLSDKAIRQSVDWAGYTTVDIQRAGGTQ